MILGNGFLKQSNRLFAVLLFSLMIFSAQSKTESINDAVSAVMNTVIKKVSHKMPMHFERAVDRYVLHIKTNVAQCAKKEASTMATYEKTIVYLFDQVATPITIDKSIKYLNRTQSAHQLLEQDQQISEECHAQYEQLCSAIALRSAQALSECARIQFLNALHEIDTLLGYWRDQNNHSVKYFFSKSPHKWIMGKSQSQQIADNIKALERRQAGLYTILGRLTEHVHAFTQCGNDYKTCYAWIEELFCVLACVKTKSMPTMGDVTAFDLIAMQLQLKLKQVVYLHGDSLATISATRMPSHIERNWIMYTAFVTAAGYAGRYYMNDTEDTIKKASIDSISYLHKNVLEGWVINPMKDFFTEVTNTDLKESLDQPAFLVDEIMNLSDSVENHAAVIFAQEGESLFESGRADLASWLDDVKKAGWVYGYELDVENIKAEELVGNCRPLEELVDKISAVTNLDLKINGYKIYIKLLSGRSAQIHKTYLDLLDNYILPMVKKIGLLAGNIGGFAVRVGKNNYWTSKFTALIPMALTSSGLAFTYRCATAKDYSEIRVALADINSIFIESPLPLDDHDYGKLVYLVHKLINRTQHQAPTKDNARNEFLVDLEKLESKNFTVAVKRGIVENMFNKYLFLGRDVKSA